MTNDLHSLVFWFPNGLSEITGVTGTYGYGPLYYLVIAWEAALVISYVAIIFRKSGTTVAKQYFWVPAGTLFVGVFLMVLGYLD